MFKALASKFNDIFSSFSSTKAINEEHIEKAIKEIRIAFLEADVSLEATKSFTSSLKEKLLGEDVIKSTTPGQMIIKLTQDEITRILAENHTPLKIESDTLNVILMVGLQGAGKTTSTGKLALKLKDKGEKVLLASLDVRRPAARLQLQMLGEKIGVSSLPIFENEDAIQIAKNAMEAAKKGNYSVLILDTAGRTELEEGLMQELEKIKNITSPSEIILTMDALSGRKSLEVASAFDAKLGLTGVILTRMESDTRGGIAFNIKFSLKKPIKYYGIGEKMEDFEEFYPERIASRILDMGDVVTLVERAKDAMDEIEMEKMQKKMEKGKFDFEDFLVQIKSLKKMGGLGKMMSFIPGASKLTGLLDEDKQNQIYKQEAIILSMTPKERKKPELLLSSYSRKHRVANGSGVKIIEVNKLLKQFETMKTMFGKIGKMDRSKLESIANADSMMKMLKP